MAANDTWFPSSSSGNTSKASLWFPGQTKTQGYAETALALAHAHQPGHHSGVGGFLAHLAGDVVSSTEGLPAGLVKLATQNPVTSAKQLYEGEKAQWSPLLTGDYNKFLHNFYEHPLGPILDVAGLLTGGAGAAGRLGLLGKFGVESERALQVGDATKALTAEEKKELGVSGDNTVNMGLYSHNPVIRARQKAFDTVTSHFPKQTPLFGESARGARALSRINAEKLARSKTVVDNYTKASLKLKGGWRHTAYLAVSTGQAPRTILADMQKHIDVANETTSKAITKLKTDMESHQGEYEKARDAQSKPITMTDKKGKTNTFTRADPRPLRKWQVKNAAMVRRLDELTGQLKHMEPTTEQALLDPKAQALFHEVQAAHMRLKKETGYEAGGDKRVDIHTALNQVKVSRDVAKVLVARDAAKAASELDGKIRKVAPLQAETRKYLHQLLRKGATFEPDKLALIEHRGELKLGEVDPESGKVSLISRHGNVSNMKAKVEASKITKLAPAEAQRYLDEAFPLSAPDVSRALYHKNGIDKLLEARQLAHKKTGYAEPVYFPDKMALDSPESSVRDFKYSGGSKATTIRNHQNLGTLYMSGVLNHDPLILAKQAMASVMTAHAADIAETLRQHATVYHGQGVPKGYVALTKMSVARPYMNEYLQQFRKEMMHHLATESDGEGMTRQFLDNHVTDKPGIDDAGHKLIIPKKVIDALAPEYQKSSVFAQAFFKKPASIWKHMVLAGRPLPFIVNNVVGNSMMYALRHAGPAGIHALVGAKNEERTLEEVFASRHLNFGQAHAIKRPTRLGKVINSAYHAVGWHEHLVRRASMIAEAKSMPIIRAELKKLKNYDPEAHEGRSQLHQAILNAEERKPGVVNQIGERIDDVAGDYRHFSKGEEAVRNFMPFYAWTRHAARSYYRLLTDKPLTAALMTRIGQQGSKDEKTMMGDLPAYMNQYIPSHVLRALGYGSKGRASVINAKVLNPEATVADTLRGITALVSGKPGDAPSDLTSNLSPFITAPIEATTGTSLLTGAPIAKNFASGHGALGGAVGNVAVNLPIPKLLETLLPAGTPGSAQRDPNDIHNLFTPTGRPKKQHQDTLSKDWQTSVLNTLLGAPVKKVDVKAAQTQEKSAKTKARNASGFHVAAPRKKKKPTVSSNWFK